MIKPNNRKPANPSIVQNRPAYAGSGKIYDGFISYSRKDLAFVTYLKQALDAAQCQIWLDLRDIPPSSQWREEMRHGIEASANFIFVISPDSIISPQCREEFEYAVATNKRLIPVMCRYVASKEIFENLRSLNFIYFKTDEPFELKFQVLKETLDTDLKWTKEQAYLLTEAMRWEPRQKDNSLLLRGNKLLEAEKWLSLAGTEKRPDLAQLRRETQFIQASRKRWDIFQRRLILSISSALIITFVLLIIAVILGNLAEQRRIQEEQQRLLAEQRGRISKAQALAGLSLSELETDPERSILLAVEAINTTRRVNEPIRNEAISALYRALKRSQLQKTLVHNNLLYSVNYSQDGRLLASAGTGGKIKLWDVSTGQERLTITIPTIIEVDTVDFSPDGNMVVAACNDGRIRLFDAKSGQSLYEFQGHQGGVQSAHFSPDGKTIVSAGADHTARIWNVANKQPIQTLTGHKQALSEAIYSPDGKLLITAGIDGEIRLWNAQNFGQPSPKIITTNLATFSLKFSPDGQSVVLAHGKEGVSVWQLANGSKLFSVGVPLPYTSPPLVASAAFSPDNRFIAGAVWDGTVRLWDAKTGVLVTTMSGATGATNNLAFNPADGGRSLASVSNEGNIRLWDVLPGNVFKRLNDPNGHMYTAAFSPDGASVVTGSNDTTAKVWEASSGRLLTILKGHTGFVNSVKYSPKGDLIITTSADRTARIWNAKTFQLVRTLQGQNEIYSAAFSPDGTLVITGGADGIARVWNVQSGQEVKRLEHKAGIWSVAFSPDNALLLTAGEDNTARLWDASSGQPKFTLTNEGLGGAVFNASFSPDGKALVTGGGSIGLSNPSASFFIKVWNVADGSERFKLKLQNDRVGNAAFSPDGKFVATSEDSRVLRFRNVTNGEEISAIEVSALRDIVYSPDGKFILAVGLFGTADIMPVTLEDVLKLASERVTRSLREDERTRFGLDLGLT